MLRIGLTGGIGSGKSTVARRLVAHGALLVDSDVLAREVVAAGTDGLTAIVETFGERVLGADGELDRPRLASMIFNDAQARQRLNAIVHPRVRDRSAAILATAPADAVVVQDVPLLVEAGLAAGFALVVVVHADAAERVRRLVRDRGLTETEARSRIAAQADDEARRAVADVWLDNGAGPEELDVAVDRLWRQRLVPFEENLRLGRMAPGEPRWVPADPTWAAQARRLCARVATAVGPRAEAVVHVGPTAVPGLPARDVLDLRVGVRTAADRAAVRPSLAEVGFLPRAAAGDACSGDACSGDACSGDACSGDACSGDACSGDACSGDACSGDGDPLGHRYGNADPGRSVDLRVCALTSPEWRGDLALRDRLRADAAARMRYMRVAEGNPDQVGITEWWGKVRSRADERTASRRWDLSLSE